MAYVRKKHVRKFEPGIYCVSIQGDERLYRYWGQSKHLTDRRAEHLYDLDHGIHYNSFVQNVYNKYKNAIFEVLERIDAEQLDEREQYYLDLHFGKDYCMNLYPIAGSPSGAVRTEETKRKISAGHIGKTANWDCPWARPLCVILDNVEYVFSGLRDAGDFLGVHRQNLGLWMKNPDKWPKKSKFSKPTDTRIYRTTAFFLDSPPDNF